jgi:hypothetical protein
MGAALDESGDPVAKAPVNSLDGEEEEHQKKGGRVTKEWAKGWGWGRWIEWRKDGEGMQGKANNWPM